MIPGQANFSNLCDWHQPPTLGPPPKNILGSARITKVALGILGGATAPFFSILATPLGLAGMRSAWHNPAWVATVQLNVFDNCFWSFFFGSATGQISSVWKCSMSQLSLNKTPQF